MGNAKATTSKLMEQLSILLNGVLRFLPLSVGLGMLAAGYYRWVELLLDSKTNILVIMFILAGLSLVASWLILESMRDEASNPEPEAI